MDSSIFDSVNKNANDQSEKKVIKMMIIKSRTDMQSHDRASPEREREKNAIIWWAERLA